MLWVFSPSETKFTAVPLVLALGSLTRLLKGIFLLRKSSEGLGLSEQGLASLSGPTNRKRLPSMATQAAQIVQDFGAGAFLLWPLPNVGKEIDNLITGSDILMHIGLAALSGRSELRLRRGHRNDKRKYRTAVQNLIFHAFLLSVEISRGCSESTLNEVQSPSVAVALFPVPLLRATLWSAHSAWDFLQVGAFQAARNGTVPIGIRG